MSFYFVPHTNKVLSGEEDLGSEDTWSDEEDIEDYGDDGDSFIEQESESCSDSASYEPTSSCNSMEEDDYTDDDCSSEREYELEGRSAYVYK